MYSVKPISFQGTTYYGIFDEVGGDIKEQSTSEETMKRSFPTRKMPQNYYCKIQAPDGQFLCTCNSKQANWYLNKGLGGKIVSFE